MNDRKRTVWTEETEGGVGMYRGCIPGDDLKTSDPNNVYTRLPRYCMNGASLKFLPK